jgi:hypothetical protein
VNSVIKYYLDIMDSSQAYVIDGNIASPLLMDESLKLSISKTSRNGRKDPMVMVAISLVLSVTGYYILSRTLGIL